MSIIILVQSSTNNGTFDVQIDGIFSPQQVTPFNVPIYGNLNFGGFEEYGNSGIESVMVPKSPATDPLFRFTINDETGNSPIIIQANLNKLDNIIQDLKTFEDNSGREISPEKKQNLDKIIKFKRKGLKPIIDFTNKGGNQ